MAYAQGIISDIRISKTPKTDTEFANILKNGSSCGYSDFSLFVTGDYDYEKAIFKAELTSDGSVSPRLTSCKATVDVPDVYDKGSTQTFGDGWKTIYFNRNFYTAPYINATLVGGTVLGSPIVRNVTNETFEIAVFDGGGSIVAGTVSWNARGY